MVMWSIGPSFESCPDGRTLCWEASSGGGRVSPWTCGDFAPTQVEAVNHHITHHVPERPFELGEKKFAANLRSSTERNSVWTLSTSDLC